ncbi:hypothetical protein Droror1_Dr00022802 [Drosera rotundifolia]
MELSGKPFSFGQPDVESIIHRFLDQDDVESTNNDDVGADAGAGAHKEEIEMLNKQLNDLNHQIMEEKRKGEMLDKKLERMKIDVDEIDELEIKELLDLKEKLEDLKKDVTGLVNELEASTSLLMLIACENPSSSK